MMKDGVYVPTQATDGSVSATSDKLKAKGRYVPKQKAAKVKGKPPKIQEMKSKVGEA